ncbi:MAG: oxidoreductase [Bacilli bacterium]|nr:oxidoreductase [Bacilli bacterium]
MMFTDKVAVITGASSGIGAWMAQELSRQGAVVILIARSADNLHLTAGKLQGKHEIFITDVTSTEQVFATVYQVVEKFGKIDILINNAGYGIFETFIDAKLETIEDMMNVNYMGMVRCTKAVLPHMLKEGSGHIVNIGSLAGKMGMAKSSGYSASKHAVLGLTNSLRQELVNTGIHVTAINPGPIDTPFFERADLTGNYVKRLKWIMLDPEKVAKAVLQAIAKRKTEVNLPFVAGAAAKLALLVPGISNAIVRKFINKK